MKLVTIQPVNVIRALLSALDLSIEGTKHRHETSTIIAQKLAAQMRLSAEMEKTLLRTSLLHDIGIANNDKVKKFSLLSKYKNKRIMEEHTENGYRLLRNTTLFSNLAEIVRYHHENWDGQSNYHELRGEEIPLISRIIHVVDYFGILLKNYKIPLAKKAKILEKIKEKRGREFDPQIVDILFECAKTESFWLDIVSSHYADSFFKNPVYFDYNKPYSLDEGIQIAELFATIIDKTSKFTSSHSRSVAGISEFLAQLRGYSQNEIKCIHIAGLLHDAGKLAVSNKILEKPGRLTEEEFDIVGKHPYFTYHILAQIENFEFITLCAAFHHESLNGKGYPFHLDAEQLPLAARIVAVADVFVALNEDRPYRKSLPVEEIKNIMISMCQSDKIDKNIFKDLFANFDRAKTIMEEIRSSNDDNNDNVVYRTYDLFDNKVVTCVP